MLELPKTNIQWVYPETALQTGGLESGVLDEDNTGNCVGKTNASVASVNYECGPGVNGMQELRVARVPSGIRNIISHQQMSLL